MPAPAPVRVRLDSALVSTWFRVARRLPFRSPSARQVRRWNRRAVAADQRRRSGATDPNGLIGAECSRYSQNGEDGIIAALVERVGSGARTFVEVGAADGQENCTRALVEDGWSGVWVEGDDERAAAGRAVSGGRPVVVVDAYVDVDNIVGLLADAGAAADPTVLVLDIDGNDYWVLDRILSAYRPRIVVAEYNARIGSRLQWAMPYDPGHAWSRSAYYGMSLAAIAGLGSSHGYRLVGCNSTGVNAFLVRDDLAAPVGLGAPGVRTVFQPADPVGSWHPWVPAEPFEATPIGDGEDLTITVDGPPPAEVPAGGIVRGTLTLTNGSGVEIGAPATDAVHLAYQWRAADGMPIEAGEPPRIVGPPWRARPGQAVVLPVAAPAPTWPGRYRLEVTCVQEHVRWFTDPGRLELPVTVTR